MRRTLLLTLMVGTMLPQAGCIIMPTRQNPAFIQPDPAVAVENPVWLPLGSEPEAYGRVFEQILDLICPRLTPPERFAQTNPFHS